MTPRKITIVFFIVIIFLSPALAAVKTLHVQETELVQVHPRSIDPDSDDVTYTYSAPLDQNGQWQTKYGDAGEYDINITASDGQSNNTKTIKLVVEKKNRPPIVVKNKVTVSEGETVDLKPVINDPDNDDLTFQFSAPYDSQGLWTTTYDDEGRYIVNFFARDKLSTVQTKIEVEVLHAPQPPTITETFSSNTVFYAREDEPITFFIKVHSEENRTLKYNWFLDGTLIAETPQKEYTFSYDGAGKHNLTIEANYGQSKNNTITQSWELEIEDVNRKPQVQLLPLTVYEGEKISVELPEKDADGDKIMYAFPAPLNSQGEWLTDYENAGKYYFNITASDNQFSTPVPLEITVIDVNRPPELHLPAEISISENQPLEWEIETTDLDGDEITVTIEDLPPGATLNQENKTFFWKPDFEFIHRKNNSWGNILNLVGVEKFFIQKRVIPLTISSCDATLCSIGTIHLKVYNNNRAPVLTIPDNFSVKEQELVKIAPTAFDPDGDVVRFSFDPPFNYKGEWQPKIGQRGEHQITIIASDGQAQTSAQTELEVQRINQQPTITVNDNIILNEGDNVILPVTAFDADNDSLKLILENMPPGASFNDGLFTWQPSYVTVIDQNTSWFNSLINHSPFLNKKLNKEEKIVELNFVASDGEFKVIHPVKIRVKNRNQKPEIIDYSPTGEVTVKMYQPVLFHLAAKDVEGDILKYKWNFGLKEKDLTGTDTIERTFTTPGKKKISVTISDGQDAVIKEFWINVLGEEYPAAASVSPDSEVALEQPPFSIGVYVIN